MKLDKDLFFPPPGGDDQLVFSYAEKLNEADTGEPAGAYMVTVDLTHFSAPDPPDPKYPSVILVTSTGTVGSAQVSLRMEIDRDEGDPGQQPHVPYRITDWTNEVLPGQ